MQLPDKQSIELKEISFPFIKWLEKNGFSQLSIHVESEAYTISLIKSAGVSTVTYHL